ncbi:MAG: hypothetical protein AAF490_26350 [Chloroflexota bacterium]
MKITDMNNSFQPKFSRKTFKSLLLTILIFLFFNINQLFAHTPHDVIYDIALSPNFSEDQLIYIISRGNFYRSTTGGESWTRHTSGLDVDDGLVALTMSPENVDLLYLSTLRNGIYESQDGGLTWQGLTDGLETEAFPVMQISDAFTVLAAGDDGHLYRKSAESDSWETVLENEAIISSIAYSPLDTSTVLIGDTLGNIFQSADDGQTWGQCCEVADSGPITGLTFSPDDSSHETYYAATKTGGVFITEDGGDSFTAVNSGLTDLDITSITHHQEGDANYSIWATSYNTGVYQLNVAEQEWQLLDTNLKTDKQAYSPHYNRPQFSLLRLLSDGSSEPTIFLASFTGLYRTMDGGNEWQKLVTLPDYLIIDHDVSPNFENDSTMIITTYIDGAYFVNEDGVKYLNNYFGIPNWRREFFVRFLDTAISPNYENDGTIFVGSNNFIFVTRDWGESWNEIALSEDYWWGIRLVGGTFQAFFPDFIEFSPNYAEDQTIFIGMRDGSIQKSTDNGETFTAVYQFDSSIEALRISPDYADDQTVLVTTVNDGFAKSVDGGDSFDLLNNGIETFDREIYLAPSPNYNADQTIYAGTINGLYMTTNGGELWEEIVCDICGENPNITSVATSPDYADDNMFIFAVHGQGVFKSTDNGQTVEWIDQDGSKQEPLISLHNNFPPMDGFLEFSPDGTIVAVSGPNVQVSSDAGDSWDAVIFTQVDQEANLFTDVITRRTVFDLFLVILGFTVVIYLVYHFLSRRKLTIMQTTLFQKLFG